MAANKSFDQAVQGWTRNTTGKLKSKIAELDIKHRPAPSKRRSTTSSNKYSDTAAVDQVRGSTSKKYGMVNRIRFRFPRHMVFVHKGVSRGHPVNNPRQAKEWFNPVIDQEIDRLADIVAENSADMVLGAFDRLKIR